MKKVLRQFRYYGSSENSSLNSPPNIDPKDLKNMLESGDLFPSEIPNLTSIAALGIQTVPGVRFRINGGENEVIVGSTGIYSIDLADNYELKYVSFPYDSLELIDHNPAAYLIIDIVGNVEE